MQYSSSISRRTLITWCASTALPMLQACGGVGETGTGISTQVIAIGPLSGESERSVTLNGIEFDLASAVVIDAFGGRMGTNELRLGVWVEIDGRFNPDLNSGVAETIRVRPAVRGVVTRSGGAGVSIEVIDATVNLDPGVVLAGVQSGTDLVPGDWIEVYGPIDSRTDSIQATRVERLSALHDGRRSFELRGRLSNVDLFARTAKVGATPISFSSASLALRASPTNGQIVRVASTEAPVSGQLWQVRRMILDQSLPQNAGFFYVEGLVYELAPDLKFDLEGVPVDAASAINRNLISSNGQRLAAVGALVEGVLIAKSVAPVVPGSPAVFTLVGPIRRFASAAQFSVRGVEVDASSARFIAPATAAMLADGVGVRIRGTFLGTRLIASRLELTPAN